MDKTDNIFIVIAPCYSVNRPPLGISLVSGFLKERSIDCNLIDLNYEIYSKIGRKDLWKPCSFYKWIDKELFEDQVFPYIKDILDQKVNNILNLSPDILGLSVFSTNIFCSLYIAKRIKKKDKSVKIVFGGPHMKSFVGGSSETFRRYSDFIVHSEGERAFYDIVKNERYPSGIIRSSDRNTTDVRYVSGKEFPLPDISLYKKNRYNHKDSFSYMYGRGCPNRCSYCEETNIYKGYRSAPDNIFRSHLRYLKENGIKTIYFSDSQVNPSEKIFVGFLDSLENGLKYQGNLFAFDWIKKRHIRLLSEKGFEKITVGVESCSSRILERMNKPLNVIKVFRILRWAYEYDIKVKLNFIVGFPTETWGDIFITMFWIIIFSVYSPQISPVASTCSALSGSELSRSPQSYGIKVHDTIDFIEENGNDIAYRRRKKKVFNGFIRFLKSIKVLS